MNPVSIHDAAFDCLMQSDIDLKVSQVRALFQEYESGGALCRESDTDIVRVEVPGRPEKPELVSPQSVKMRKLTTPEGRAVLVHAVCHIEFNAINLALDAIYRFREMPDQFYRNWLLVAAEEAKHFSLLRQRLSDMGHQYGDMPAHNGLWEMAVKTDHDVLIRMALVPRVLEARGLDVTPGMIKRLEQVGDTDTVAILHIILAEEIGHVAIGSHWFKYCCEKQDLEPEATFRELLKTYMGGGLRGPFYTEGRLQAGFTEEELAQLSELSP
ncbi:ferritin-like domain-containing protein [Leucothrix pacifica]|nr:ferritin-like domain-containing protein [Leucothrix pacifica]